MNTDLGFCPECGRMSLISDHNNGQDRCLECDYEDKGNMKTVLKGYHRPRKTDEVWA